MDERYGNLLDGPEPDGETLRAIVGRAQRHGRRAAFGWAAGAAVVALLVGGAGEKLISSSGNKSQTVASATGSATTTPGEGVGMPRPAEIGSSGAPAASNYALPPATLTRLFTRTSGDITIRAFTVDTPFLKTAGACFPAVRTFQAEVSSPGMVGVATSVAGVGGTDAIDSATLRLVGVAENAPVEVVIASVSSKVTAVKFSSSNNASDQMAPVGGWVVLAVPAPSGTPAKTAAAGTLVATGAGGATLQQMTIGYQNPVMGGPVPLAGPACSPCNRYPIGYGAPAGPRPPELPVTPQTTAAPTTPGGAVSAGGSAPVSGASTSGGSTTGSGGGTSAACVLPAGPAPTVPIPSSPPVTSAPTASATPAIAPGPTVKAGASTGSASAG